MLLAQEELLIFTFSPNCLPSCLLSHDVNINIHERKKSALSVFINLILKLFYKNQSGLPCPAQIFFSVHPVN